MADVRLMNNIQPVTVDEADSVGLLQPKTYQYKDDAKRSTHFGLIAQDVETVYPNLIDTGANGYKVVRSLELIAVLVSKIQSLEKRIDEMETHIRDNM